MILDCLKSRYKARFGDDGVSLSEMDKMEKALSVSFPREFKDVMTFCSGGIVGDIPLLDFSDRDAGSIVSETLRLRNCVFLHTSYVLLADLSESLIFLNCGLGPRRGMVVWCDQREVCRFEKDESLDEERMEAVWGSVSEFLDYLLRS